MDAPETRDDEPTDAEGLPALEPYEDVQRERDIEDYLNKFNRPLIRPIGPRPGFVSGFSTIRAKYTAALNGNGAAAAEIRAAAAFSRAGFNVTFIPEGKLPKPDFAAAGDLYDVYSPITNNPNRIISELATKGKQGATAVILDLSRTSVTKEELEVRGSILNRIRGSGAKNIRRVIVLHRESILTLPGDYASLSSGYGF